MSQGYPVSQPLGKTGNAPIVKVGHTSSGVFGSEPMAKASGSAGTMPSPQEFGK